MTVASAWRRLAAVAALLAGIAAPAVAMDPSASALEAMRERGLQGRTGIVEGRIYLERARPNVPDDPLAGVSILVVPRTDALVTHLEAVKRESRESMRGFREAAPSTRAAIEDYEAQLWHTGYPDAAVRTSTDATGMFRAELPTGAWLLVAERSVFVPIDSARSGAAAPTAQALDPLARYSTAAYQHFLPTTRLTGYDAVSIWLRELTVEPGATIALDLHDRGLWLSGVAEEAKTPRRVRFGGFR